MAVRAESSRMAQLAAEHGGHGLIVDDGAVGGAGGRSVPRSLAGETVVAVVSGRRKGKQPATSEQQDDDGPRTREIEPGITMYTDAQRVSPFTLQGKHFFAVDFDAHTSVEDVTFENCVFINVSFKGCILHNAKFMNVYFQDMEFKGCNFNQCTLNSHGEFDQTWEGRDFENDSFICKTLPVQISFEWLKQMAATQVIPPKPSADYLESIVLAHEQDAAANAEPYQPYELTPDGNANGDPEKFDFGRLGNKVYPAADLSSPGYKAWLKMWTEFADEQEQARERERQDVALKRAREEAALHSVTGDVSPGWFSMESEHVSAPNDERSGAVAAADAFGEQVVGSSSTPSSLLSTDRRPLQPTCSNNQAIGLPPHLRSKSKDRATDVPGVPVDGEDDGEEEEELVYRPALRKRY